MTPNHDHATLFLAPPSPSAVETAGKPESAIDSSATAMRRLRDPFAVQPAQGTCPAEARRTA